MRLSPQRSAQVHDLSLYAFGAVTLAVSLAEGNVEVGLLFGALCWVPSLVVRFIDGQYRRAVLLGFAVVLVVAMCGLAGYVDRTTPPAAIWTPPANR